MSSKISRKSPKVDIVLKKESYEIASPFKRGLAFISDLFIIQLLLIPFSAFFENMFSREFSQNIAQNIELLNSNPNLINSIFYLTIIMFLFIFIYFVYFEYKLNTPGKILLGLKVVKASEENFIEKTIKEKKDKNQDRISLFQAILRNLFLIPIFPFYLLWIIDPIYLIFTKKRLSDIFSKTIVVNNKEPIKKETIFYALKIILILFLISVSISLMLPIFKTEINYGKNIALIPIHGVLSVSEGDTFTSDVVSSESVIQKLEKAEKNPEIKAIILDINSPGGSPVATDEISQKIKSINKTTVAVIREYGASGSYWIASSTDYIFANRMSLVGSIGVIGSYLDFSGLLQRYNITYQRYVSGNLKDMGSPFKPASEEEKIIFQKLIDDLNNIFIEEVAQNRNLSVDYVNELATGQVFLGIEAKNLKLIDELGTKEDAIKFIEKKLNITANVIEYKDSKSIFDTFLSSKSLKIGNYLYYNLPLFN